MSSYYRIGHGNVTDVFFNYSLLSAMGGIALWILFDFSNFSNAYLAGKILLVYGAMNFSFFAIFPSFTEAGLNLKHLRWFIYLYISSMLFEVIIMILFKERPPVIMGNGIRLIVSVYWLSSLMKIPGIRKLTAWNIVLWIIVIFHLAGLAGITFLSETGIHFGHLYLVGAVIPVLLYSLPIFSLQEVRILKGKFTYIIFGLIFFAALTRATAHTMQQSNLSHLAYASFVLIIALILFIFRHRKAF
jgi:hypothetical protein